MATSGTQGARALLPRASLAAALLASLALASSAQAYQTHVLDAAHSPFAITQPSPGPFASPIGISVDNSTNPADPSKGDVYVDDFGHGQVVKFNANGTQLAVIGGFANPAWSAVDPANGDLYVGDYSGGFVEKFDPSGNPITSWGTNGKLTVPGAPAGVAISPTTGDLYVGVRGPQTVYVYDSSGNSITQFPVSIASALDEVAVDPSGDVYVIDERYLASEYKPSANPPTATTTFDTGTVIDSNAPFAVEVDPLNAHIYVAETSPASVIVQLDSAANPLESFGSGQIGPSAGLAISAAHVVYGTDIGAGNADIFKTGATLADAITKATSPADVGRNSATIKGHLDPDTADSGPPISACHFDYGTDTSYTLGPAPCSPDPASSPPGSNFISPTDVSANLSGLSGLTTYHYRVVATTANGTSFGVDKTFTTPAVIGVSTNDATNVQHGSATLNGTFEPAGLATTYHFEYGTAGDCASNSCTSAPIPDAGPFSDPAPTLQNPSLTLNNLQPDTTYHYRIAATNTYGTTFGADKTFHVPPAVKGLSTDPPTNVNPDHAMMNGSLDPDGLDTHYHFEYGIDTNYGQNSPTVDAGSTPGEVSVTPVPITDLQPNHTYHYRLVAADSVGVTIGQDQAFTTPSTPTIDALSSSNVTTNSADLHAQINPLGSDTTYHFEYGTTPSYGTSIPVPDAGPLSGSSDQSVNIHLAGLQAVTYHFRVVATNKWGTKASTDQTFNFYPPNCPNAHVRQQTGAEFLPDCRAYELVSAADAGGAIIFGGSGITNGDSPYADNFYAYGAGLGLIPNAGPATNAQVDRYVATRTGNGWLSQYVGIPGDQTQFTKNEFGSISSNEFTSSKGGDAFGGGAGGSNAVEVRDNFNNVLGTLPTNLATVPGGDAALNRGVNSDWMMSPDFSHFVFSTNSVAFAPHGLSNAPGSAYDNNVSSGAVTIVSTTPGGKDISQDAGGSGEVIQIPAVGTDGSHILMSTQASNGGVHLYMRVNDAVSYDVSIGKDGLNHGVNYVGMTPDGSKVYFTSNEQLTADDQDTSTDLYVWSEATKALTRLSTANNGGGNTDVCAASWIVGCGVAPVADISIASGSGDIYFYSPEQLDGSKGLPNQQNLYVNSGGQVRYVTTFPSGNGVSRFEVSPDGRHAAFVTSAQMTGYNNQGYQEMYSYDPASGVITCVSCNPTGAPPVGDVSASDSGLFMSNDGRTFFYTPDALVPQDTNQLHDVYEYVDGRAQLITQGTGSHDVNIISDPSSTSARAASFEGVSADGVNVYFSTFDTLVGQDLNGDFLKIYDARTNGGFPFVPINAPCEAADECHGPGSSPPATSQLGSTASLGSGGNATTTVTNKKHRKHRHHRRKTHAARPANRSQGGSK